MKKKLIEVALPLGAINRASAAEKKIHVGTTSNIHAWWARRPLAACRAVLFASLVDDPGGYLPPDEAEKKRLALFRLIERLVQWEANNDESLLKEIREEIAACGVPPTVVDPFCGSGSIPIEALRLGLDAIGYDLNPIAVTISKALVETPAIVAAHPPINPSSRRTLSESTIGFSGFRADLDYYGSRVVQRARESVAALHNGSYDGETPPIAWLWSRTAECPNPGCRVRIPLVSSFWLSKTAKSRACLAVAGADPTTGRVGFRIVVGAETSRIEASPITEAGAVCPICSTTVSFEALREQGRSGRMGFQLNAYVTKRGSNMMFHVATAAQEAAAMAVTPEWVPESKLPEVALGFRVQKYGLTSHKDLFLPRQLSTLCEFSKALEATIEEVRKDAGKDGPYGTSICVYLALFFDRFVQTNNALVRWFVHATRPSKAQPTFDKQTVQMVWDFAEANPIADSTGGWTTCCKYPQTALDCLPRRPGRGAIVQRDSASIGREGASRYLFSTDPPYFDNIGYADLSDFFYIWLRRVLRPIYPDIFKTLLVPKDDEIIADPSRHEGDRSKARAFFYQRLGKVFRAMHATASDDYPMTLFYAFKQEEITNLGGAVSTGWEGLLQALIDSSWTITGTWPISTEHANRPRGIGANALQSSIVLVCRPRRAGAPVTTRREFAGLLRAELPGALAHLQSGNIEPVDLAQAAIGPGMGVYTRFSEVLDAEGQRVSVRDALSLINQTLDESLAEQEGDFDADSRWALAWFGDHGFGEGPFGDAHTYFVRFNTAENALKQAGIIQSGRSKVRLLRPDELPKDWDPRSDRHLTAWEMVHQLIRVLEEGGENAAADLAAKLGTKAEIARELCYRLFAVCGRKKRATESLSYNALVKSWPEIMRLAREGAQPRPKQTTFEEVEE